MPEFAIPVSQNENSCWESRRKYVENKFKNCQIKYTFNTRIYFIYSYLLYFIIYFYELFPPKAEVRGSNPLECAILSFTFNGLIAIFRCPIWAVVSCHTICHRRHTMGSIRKRGNTYQAQVRLSGHRTASMLARYAHPDPVKVREKMLNHSLTNHN